MMERFATRAKPARRRGVLTAVFGAIVATTLSMPVAELGAATATSEPPLTAPPATDPPPTDAVPPTDPPASDPPATDAPATDPPATDPPPSDPPATEPPATDAPATDPPAAAGPIVIAAEPGAGALGLIKEASVAEVSPGESFNYTLTASCSGLERSCINAVLTDELPAEFDISNPPESTDQYDVTLVGHTLTIAFKIPLISPPNPPGSVGLPDGSSLNIVVGVQLPSESQIADGTPVDNTAAMTADGSDPVEDTATVTVVVPRVVTPVATKTWSDGTAVAGSGEASTITLGVRNASSSTTEITELAVEDREPETFDKFDVTGLGAVTFPAGADQVVVLACTLPAGACVNDADWAASAPQTGAPLALPVAAGTITGLRFEFSNSAGTALPYDPTGGSVAVEMALRDTLRSDGSPYQPVTNDQVTNCATPSATDAVLGASSGASVCASTTVFPAQATMSVAKQFFADSDGNYAANGRAVLGQGSPVSALTSATNTSPFPVATMTITEPSPTSPNELSKVDVTDYRIVFPNGATDAEVTIVCAGTPTTVNLTAPPTTVDQPTGCGAGESFDSVTVTFTGIDADGNGTIAQNAVARLGVHGTLNDTADDSDVTNGPGAGGDGVLNCADATAVASIDGVSAAAGSACATLGVWVAYSEVGGVKSAQVPFLLPGLPRLFTLSFTNSGTIAATNVIMADPVDPTAAGNFFDSVRLADLVLPATPAVTAEVYDPDVSDYVPYVAGDTALLTRARGFRIIVPTVAPGATYQMQFNVMLRDDVPVGTTFSNCAGVSSDSQPFSGFCSQNLTVGESTSGAALQKAISPSESVRPQPGLPGQTVQVKLSLQNTGTLYLRQLMATDNDPAFYDAVDLTGQVLVNFPPGSDRVRVDACTGACGDADWTLGAVTALTSPGLPAGVAPGDVRGVRVTFTAVPVATPTNPSDEYRIRPGTNFPATGPCTNASVCIGFVPRIDLRSAPGTPVPDTLVNVAFGGYESRGQTPGVLAPIPATQSSHQLTDGTAQLQLSKSADRTAAPGESIPFILRTTNTGTGPIGGLTVVEPIPAGLDFSPLNPLVPYDITYTLPAGAPEPPEVVFTSTTDPTTGQATELRWEFPGWDFLPGAVVTIQFRTVLAPGVVAGQTIENRAGASGARPDLTCNNTGVPRPGESTDDPLYGDGRFCTSGAVVTVEDGNAFRTQKWVAGNPDLGLLNTQTGAVVALDDPACPRLDVGGQQFTRFPCAGRVLPGQGFDFYLQLTNAGTNPATEVRLVDVFPHPGDTGVLLTGQARGTEWSQAPVLLSSVTLAGKGSAAISYTSAAAPVCTSDLQRPPVACSGGAWPLGGYDPSATAFRAFVTFEPGDLLLPGQTTALRFRMAAPANPAGATTGDVAWNSFAHTEFFQSEASVSQLPPTEPIKVGIAIVYGGLTISKALDDPTGDYGDVAFEIRYECTVTPEGGEPVIVTEGSVSLTGGEQATIGDVPAGAGCFVWEPDPQGLITNAPDRASALRVQIPTDGSVAGAEVEIVNSATTTTTSTTSTTSTTTVGSPSTTSGSSSPSTSVDPGSSSSDPAAPTTTAAGGVGGVGGDLPKTGSDVGPTLLLAALLVALGSASVLLVRRVAPHR